MALNESEERGYCDLHLHILPGIDDGARTIAASLEILTGLFELGYRHFVATPHAADRRWTYGRDLIAAKFDELQMAVTEKGLSIDLQCGAEYTYGERFRSDVRNGQALTLGSSTYVLLELPEEFVPATMPETLFSIGASGYYPVLAHPERCVPYQSSPTALEELASGRALVQVSFRSLAGTFGRRIKKTAWTLVETGIADLVATDCHSPRELKKVVIPVLKALHKRLNARRIDELLGSYPRRMMKIGDTDS